MKYIYNNYKLLLPIITNLVECKFENYLLLPCYFNNNEN
jgi:hypothetical protein